MKAIMIRYGIVLALGIALGVGGVFYFQRPADSTTTRDESGKKVTVDRSDLRPQDIAPHVADPGNVTQIVSGQRKQKQTPLVVMETIGTIAPSQEPQKVEAITSVATDDRGQFVASSRLFQILPDQSRIPLADTQTTVVTVKPKRASWRAGFDLQAGAGYASGLKALVPEPFGVVAFQWLVRGTSDAAEDSSLALLSPAILLTSESAEIALLPISFNLGRIPHTPFRDLWLSPLVSPSPRVGLVLTATF